MAIDPKQERVLRDGTASPADRPRRIDRQSVRAQAENPPVERRRTNARRTAAVADIRVNLPSGTPVEEFSRAAGAERIPELGGRSDRDEPERDQPAPESAAPKAKRHDRPAVGTGEARRAMKARREHSKGDGNFPSPEPRAELIEERPEDRTPHDVPKARDDRSAPKGNATTGQADRNPRLEVRDENGTAKSAAPKKAAAAGGRRSSGSRAPAKSKPQAASKRRSTARGTSAPKRQTERPAVSAGQRGRAERPASGKPRSPQMKAAAARGSRKPVTKRALRRSGPRPESGSTRGGKR
jgi:hypothetical protein